MNREREREKEKLRIISTERNRIKEINRETDINIQNSYREINSERNEKKRERWIEKRAISRERKKEINRNGLRGIEIKRLTERERSW